jgi:hypothetical protein
LYGGGSVRFDPGAAVLKAPSSEADNQSKQALRIVQLFLGENPNTTGIRGFELTQKQKCIFPGVFGRSCAPNGNLVPLLFLPLLQRYLGIPCKPVPGGRRLGQATCHDKMNLRGLKEVLG